MPTVTKSGNSQNLSGIAESEPDSSSSFAAAGIYFDWDGQQLALNTHSC